jgi:hypothetical protein
VDAGLLRVAADDVVAELAALDREVATNRDAREEVVR